MKPRNSPLTPFGALPGPGPLSLPWPILALAALFLTLIPRAARAEENTTVHVLTMAPHSDLFTRFGHTALMVEHAATREKKVYNFGEFDYDDPDLMELFAL